MDPLLAQLARRRRELGLTQKALARRSRVSLATLQNVEADRANPSLRILRSLLDALELDLRATAEPSCWDALIGLGLPLAAIGPNTRPPRGTDLPRLIRQAAALERAGRRTTTAGRPRRWRPSCARSGATSRASGGAACGAPRTSRAEPAGRRRRA
jgi:transcriptional regulator with XRE-family HTH domain